MSDIKILSEAQLREAVPLDLAAVDCVEAAFKALADGGVVMPPVLSMHLPQVNGEVDIKTAYLPGAPRFAVKMSPGFFDNPARGLPSTSGLMVLFSAETGQVEAVLLDNGYLTDVRTAAAGAVAARALSRPDSTHALILGAGTQARMQLQALCLVRPIEQATFWARDTNKAEQAAKDCADTLGIEVKVSDDRAEAAQRADIIITTTPSREAIFQANWLRAGHHITAMGSDQPGKGELAPECLKRADIYVPDSLSQTRVMGELRSAIEVGLVAADADFAQLGQILGSEKSGNQFRGRTKPDQITIADLTGTGVQDTAIANHALVSVKAAGDTV